MRAGVTRDVGCPVALATHEAAVGNECSAMMRKGLCQFQIRFVCCLRLLWLFVFVVFCVMVCILIALIMK
jgi:hypothetical protein